MATAEAPRFGYHFKDWQPRMKPFPDLVPLVGMVIMLDRMRKDQGFSYKEELRSFAQDIRSPRILASIGTANWPEGTDLAANLRSCLMAGRNATFVGYHFITAIWAPELISRAPSLVNTVVEHLPKLPFP